MAEITAAQLFGDLSIDMVDDNDGVTSDGDVLLVHGKPFARLSGEALAVLLPPARRADLIGRGIASGEDGDWLLFDALDLWSEMAREGHEFVGEPPVGHDS